MQKQYSLVSIYDAHSDKEIFGNPEVVSRAHALALAIAQARLGATGRVGSQVVNTVLTTLIENGAHVVGISPAATLREHANAYRLPHVAFPLMFTGRGALGADLMALASSHGVIVAGSDTESLLGIVSYAGERGIPIGVYTQENPNDVRARVHFTHPHATLHLHVYADASKVVQEVAAEIRRQHLDMSK